MSVLRDINFLSQMRWDIPQGRLVESAVRGDFDLLAGRIIAGDQPLVVRGFELANIATGVAATSLILVTADSILMNLNASESGSMLWVPTDRANETLDPINNSRVVGSWSAGKTNYIGVDLTRSPDADTTDTVYFKDPDTGDEVARSVPTGRILDYKIVLTTTPMAAQPNLVPVAVVVVNSSGIVTAVTDARNLAYRLGSGGDSPDTQNSYPWAQGRTETTSGLTNLLFTGGDKAIGSDHEWRQAMMTRVWELGGGEYWYSATADRNVQMVWGGAQFSNGENFEWDGTNLHWKGLSFTYDNSTEYFNDIQDQITDSAGLTDLADGECIYVDLNRADNSSDLVAQKAELISLGAGDPPGSRWVIARRIGSDVFTLGWKYPVGTWIAVATTSSVGIVKLSRAASTPSAPIVIADTGGTIAAPADTVGLTVTAGATSGVTGRNGVTSTGGSSSNASYYGGSGVEGTGGANSSTGGGGLGGYFVGGASSGGFGGGGVTAVGGQGSGGAGGVGVKGTGGEGSASNGGPGGLFYGGVYNSAPGDGVIGVGRGTNGVSASFTAYDSAGAGGVFVAGLTNSVAAGFYAQGVIGVGGSNSTNSSGNDVSSPSSPLPGPSVGVTGLGGVGTEGGSGGVFFARATDAIRSGLWGYGSMATGATAARNGGSGVRGIGGAGSSGFGPATGGFGGIFNGGAAGAGNSDGGVGAQGIGGAKSGSGQDGAGLLGQGGGSAAPGVLGLASSYVAYSNSNCGVLGIAAASTGPGVLGVGNGASPAVQGSQDGSGAAGYFTNSSTGLPLKLENAQVGPAHGSAWLVVQGAEPSAPNGGELYVSDGTAEGIVAENIYASLDDHNNVNKWCNLSAVKAYATLELPEAAANCTIVGGNAINSATTTSTDVTVNLGRQFDTSGGGYVVTATFELPNSYSYAEPFIVVHTKTNTSFKLRMIGHDGTVIDPQDPEGGSINVVVIGY